MERLKKFLSNIKKSHEFKEWHKENKDSYLSDCFALLNDRYDLNKIDWQVDYYNPHNDEMTSFSEKDNKVSIKKDQKILKDKRDIVKELDVSKVKTNADDVIKKIKEKYPDQIPNKIIVILQNIDITVWNITFVTRSFNVLNVKIDAENADVIDESLKPVFEIKK